MLNETELGSIYFFFLGEGQRVIHLLMYSKKNVLDTYFMPAWVIDYQDRGEIKIDSVPTLKEPKSRPPSEGDNLKQYCLIEV